MKSFSISRLVETTSADLFVEHRRSNVYLSGLSKISALPQMKVAWIATTGPDELTEGGACHGWR